MRRMREREGRLPLITLAVTSDLLQAHAFDEEGVAAAGAACALEAQERVGIAGRSRGFRVIMGADASCSCLGFCLREAGRGYVSRLRCWRRGGHFCMTASAEGKERNGPGVAHRTLSRWFGRGTDITKFSAAHRRFVVRVSAVLFFGWRHVRRDPRADIASGIYVASRLDTAWIHG